MPSIAPVEYRTVPVTDVERVGPVVDDLQTISLGHLGDGFHIAGVAEDVGGDNRARIALDPLFDGLRIQVPAGLVDVDEDRPDTFPLQRAGGGDEAERRGDGAAGQLQCPIGDLQRQGAVVGEHDVANAEVIAQTLFQFGDERPVIGQPAGRIDAVHVAHELAFVTQIRLGDIDHRDVPIGSHVEIEKRNQWPKPGPVRRQVACRGRMRAPHGAGSA